MDELRAILGANYWYVCVLLRTAVYTYYIQRAVPGTYVLTLEVEKSTWEENKNSHIQYLLTYL